MQQVAGAPIPLHFDYEQFEDPRHPLTQEALEPVYLGPRFRDSLEMHRAFANRPDSYPFAFPPRMNVIEALQGAKRPQRAFVGMNPGWAGAVQFDSLFECGNLDMAF